MAFARQKFNTNIYAKFKTIEKSAHHDVTRFYEEHKEQLVKLDFRQYFEVLNAYADALFEIGAYHKHIKIADEIIETSIYRNIQCFRGSDVYYNTLFKKAASYYNSYQFGKSEHILRELIKINPTDKHLEKILNKCLYRQNPSILRNSKAIGIFFFLLTAAIISVEVLVVRSFYKNYVPYFEIARFTSFGIGLFSLIFGEFSTRWQIQRQVKHFVRMIKYRKKTKETPTVEVPEKINILSEVQHPE